MSITLVQQQTGSSLGTTTLTMVLGSTPASGSVLVVSVTGSINNTPSGTPSCTGVSNWTPLGSSNTGATTHTEMWAGDVGGGAGNTVTVVNSIAATFRGNVTEFSSSNHLSATGIGFYNPATSAPVTASLTPTNARSCVVVVAGSANTGSILTPTGGFTALSTANTVHAYAYRIIPSASGAYQSGWTASPTPFVDTVIGVVYENVGGGTFKASFARNANSTVGN